MKMLHGEYISIDCQIGRPYSITSIDSLLYFYDRFDGKLFTIFDLKNKKYIGRFVSEGRGPNEVSAPIDILPYPQQQELYTFERNTSCLNIFGIPNMEIKSKLTFSNHPSKIQKTKDYYVGFGIFDGNHKSRFSIYAHDGELLYKDGKYPFDGENMTKIPRFMVYQGYHCSSPNNNFFVIGGLMCDHLEFYEVGEKEMITLEKYESKDAKVVYDNGMRIDEDCIINYTWAFGTDQYCYMLYSGKTYQENEHQLSFGDMIIVFNWHGNHIKTFKLSNKVETFCVDEKNNIIYSVSLDKNGEYGIMRFEI